MNDRLLLGEIGAKLERVLKALNPCRQVVFVLACQWRKKLSSQWLGQAGAPAFQALLKAFQRLEDLISLVSQAFPLVLQVSQPNFQGLLLPEEFLAGALGLVELLRQTVEVFRNLDFQGFQLRSPIVMGGFPGSKLRRQHGAMFREGHWLRAAHEGCEQRTEC